jgi:hypothetical protein
MPTALAYGEIASFQTTLQNGELGDSPKRGRSVPIAVLWKEEDWN